MHVSTLIYWIVCYFAGNFITAYFVGKWKKVDLRQYHSQNLGARNAGRVLGRAAFFITFFGDALKGSLVILLGQFMNLEQWILAVGMLFVIVGHLYPIWLRFHGGKGVAAFIGTGLCLDPVLFVWMIIGTLSLFLVVRSLTIGMVGGFSLYIASMVWEGKLMTYSAVILSICLIIWKHRRNLSQKE